MSALRASSPFDRFPQPPYDVNRPRPVAGVTTEPLELVGGGPLELPGGGVLELTVGGVGVSVLQYRPGNVDFEVAD